MPSRAIVALLALVLASSAARASTCPPAAIVGGDPDLATELRQRIGGDGIALIESTACPAVHVEVSRRAEAIVLVQLLPGDERSRERVVTELGTAATVIESWTRTDLDSTLFAYEPPAARPAVVFAFPDVHASVLVVPPRPSLQVFSAFEASVADDRTGWLGVVLGACVQLGTVCASARVRFSAVTMGPHVWATRERHGEDVLFGGDVPRRVGATKVTLGFGAGVGATHTGLVEPKGMRGSETFGLRADAHVAWTIPIAHKLAVDLSASLDIAQVTDVETSGTPGLADEPRWLGRLGAGLRYGGP